MEENKCPPVGTYVRHNKTGQLAQVVEKDGSVWIKPDLPGSPVYYPASQYYDWNVEHNAKKLPPGSWAFVAYAAHCALCEMHPEMKRQTDWKSLHPLKKAEWIERRVKFDNVLQLELFNLISEFLEKNA